MLKMMADQGTFFTPTFEVYDFHSTVSAPHIKVRAEALMEIHIRSTELAIKEGVRIVAGTDAGGFVHGDNARELELMVEKGMSNMLAIQSATGYAAECCGIGKEVGTIAAGKQADVLVVDGDPLQNISVLRDRERLLLIMKGGEAYSNRLAARELQPA
jgi:imidazolonepropionase-like amidohydrolase